jgi:hypothetical protein
MISTIQDLAGRMSPKFIAEKICFLAFVITFLMHSDLQAVNSNSFEKESVNAVKSGEVRMFHGKPTIFINGSPVHGMIYALTQRGSFSWNPVPQKNLNNFTRIGFDLFQVDVWLNDIWTPGDNLDMQSVARQIKGITTICPSAAIIIRFHVDAPDWWNVKNPGESVSYADGPSSTKAGGGDVDRSLRSSIASEKWQSESTGKLQQFCKMLAAMPEGNHIIGMHIAGAVYGEWHYWGFPHEPDTGPSMTQYFRQWLRNKYHDYPALQQAWSNPKVTLSTVTVPNMSERQGRGAGVFRDPLLDRNVIDYYHCQQQLVADTVIHFCHCAKEAWPRPLITGCFYGYFFNMFGAQVTGGHLETEKILSSPYIDYLSAPLSYELVSRQLGGTGQQRGLTESCRINGKLWLDEVDHPTFLGDCFERESPSFRQTTLKDSISVLQRNAMSGFSRGMGMWWYDFGPKGEGGWWDHNDLLGEIKQIKELTKTYLASDYESQADVLLVYDNEVFYYLNQAANETKALVNAITNTTSADFYHSGAVFDIVFLPDLKKISLDRYKVVVFANTFLLDSQQRDYIHNYVAKNGRTLVWLYAPGYIYQGKCEADNIADTIGIKVASLKGANSLQIAVDSQKGFPSAAFGSLNTNVSPLFIVADPDAEVFGKLSGVNQVGLAKKKLADSTAWFCSLPLSNPDVIRAILKDSGAHIYDDKNDTIYCGNGMLCIHSGDGGHRKLWLKNGKSIEFELKPGSTKVFDSRSGKALF